MLFVLLSFFHQLKHENIPTGLCEVSQQQNETQTVGAPVMAHTLPMGGGVTGDGHQTAAVQGAMSGFVDTTSMSTVATSLGVPNNTVVSMATMTQPMNQLTTQVQPSKQHQNYNQPSYRGRPRGRRPAGSTLVRGGWTGGGGGGGTSGGVGGNGSTAGSASVGEKRSAATAGLNSNVRRPYRGAYRGTWPSRSPSKTSPTGSNQSTLQGSNSQGIASIRKHSDE